MRRVIADGKKLAPPDDLYSACAAAEIVRASLVSAPLAISRCVGRCHPHHGSAPVPGSPRIELREGGSAGAISAASSSQTRNIVKVIAPRGRDRIAVIPIGAVNAGRGIRAGRGASMLTAVRGGSVAACPLDPVADDQIFATRPAGHRRTPR